MNNKMIKYCISICIYLQIILLITIFSCSQESKINDDKLNSNVTKVSAYVVKVDGSSIEFENQNFQSMAEKIVEDSKKEKNNVNGDPNHNEIKEIAEEYGLMDETKTNPHLSFLDGDIAYWYEQGLSLERLRIEFGARKIVLDAAEKNNVIIGDQGKLSWAAQQIMANLLKERQKALK